MTKKAWIAKSALFGAAVVTAGTLLAGRSAYAQNFTTTLMNTYSCADPTYGTSGTYFSGNAVYPSRSSYTPSCSSNHTSNAAASVVTAVETLRAATTQTLNLVAGRIAAVRTGNVQQPVRLSLQDPNKKEFGVAGGSEAMQGIGVWAQGAYTRIDNNNSATQFDGYIVTALMGIDKKFMKDRLLIGLSAGYETMSLDTTFNRGNLDSDGFLVVPYMSWKFDDVFSIAASAGGGWISYDMDRLDPANNAKFTGSTDATRYFGAATLNADKRYDKVRVGGNFGVAYTHESRDSFTEKSGALNVAVASQDTRLGQIRLGGNAGYDFGLIEPYVGLLAQYDFSKSSQAAVAANQTKPSDDDFGLVPSIGVNLKFSPNFSGVLEGSTMLLRDNYKEHTGLARIRVDF